MHAALYGAPTTAFRDGDIRVLWVRHYSGVTGLELLARSGRVTALPSSRSIAPAIDRTAALAAGGPH